MVFCLSLFLFFFYLFRNLGKLGTHTLEVTAQRLGLGRGCRGRQLQFGIGRLQLGDLQMKTSINVSVFSADIKNKAISP